ncbi:hypothetical protein L7F22_017790 [Adiantum nelumboides]|nr:hypothetical protein [Adiantum nelumboides]
MEAISFDWMHSAIPTASDNAIVLGGHVLIASLHHKERELLSLWAEEAWGWCGAAEGLCGDARGGSSRVGQQPGAGLCGQWAGAWRSADGVHEQQRAAYVSSSQHDAMAAQQVERERERDLPNRSTGGGCLTEMKSKLPYDRLEFAFPRHVRRRCDEQAERSYQHRNRISG